MKQKKDRIEGRNGYFYNNTWRFPYPTFNVERTAKHKRVLKTLKTNKT